MKAEPSPHLFICFSKGGMSARIFGMYKSECYHALAEVSGVMKQFLSPGPILDVLRLRLYEILADMAFSTVGDAYRPLAEGWLAMYEDGKIPVTIYRESVVAELHEEVR